MYSSTTSGVAVMLENLSLAPRSEISRITQSTLVRRLLKKMRPCRKDFWREADRRSVIIVSSVESRPGEFTSEARNVAAVAYRKVHGRLASHLPSRAPPDATAGQARPRPARHAPRAGAGILLTQLH